MSGLWLRDPGEYRGHRLHSAPGTQEAAMALLRRHVPTGASVLDIASGSGAMLARLEESGFHDLHAVMRDPEIFGGTETLDPGATRVSALDMNGPFSSHYSRRFDLVVSSEVIEHLHAPRDFLHQAHSLLEDDGHLLITTPNLANWIGRWRFLLLGELRWFDRDGFRRLRHVSPITDAWMRGTLSELGFDLVEATAGGSFSGPLRALLTAPLSLPFLLLAGRKAWGDCNIYLARKASPAPR